MDRGKKKKKKKKKMKKKNNKRKAQSVEVDWYIILGAGVRVLGA